MKFNKNTAFIDLGRASKVQTSTQVEARRIRIVSKIQKRRGFIQINAKTDIAQT